jgi:hypothetical protein
MFCQNTCRQLQRSRPIDCATSTCPRGPKISAFENLKNLDIKTPKLVLFTTRVRKIPSTRVLIPIVIATGYIPIVILRLHNLLIALMSIIFL